MSLLGLLVALIVICVFAWAAKSIMDVFAVPPQIKTVVLVLFVLFVVLWLAQSIGSLPNLHLR